MRALMVVLTFALVLAGCLALEQTPSSLDYAKAHAKARFASHQLKASTKGKKACPWPGCGLKDPDKPETVDKTWQAVAQLQHPGAAAGSGVPEGGYETTPYDP